MYHNYRGDRIKQYIAGIGEISLKIIHVKTRFIFMFNNFKTYLDSPYKPTVSMNCVTEVGNHNCIKSANFYSVFYTLCSYFQL